MKKGTIINNVTAAVSAFVMGVAISDALWIKSRKEERRRREEDFYDDEGLFFDDDDDDEGERRYPELNVDSLRTIWGYEVDDLVDNEIMKPAGELLEESADLTPNELEAVRYLIRACVGYIVETGSFEERNFLMLRTFLSYAEAADCDDTVDLLFREEKNKNDNFAMREYVSWYEHYRALVILYGKEKVVSAALLIADDIVEKLYGYHARYSYSMAFCRHLSNAIRDAGISEEFEEAIQNGKGVLVMQETEKKYLKFYQKLAYGAGDLASNASYGLVSSFLMLYLSDVAGLNTGIVGTLMLVSKALDGLSDVVFGNMIDRTKSKLGKARPWMLYAQLGVSLCLVFLFSIPQGFSETAKYAYFFVFYTSLNAIFYTANGIAYAALSALITNNKNERVQLGSFRFMFAIITNIVMGFAVTSGVESFGGGAKGWRMIAIICAVIGLVVNTISCLSVRELDESEIEKEDKPQDDKIGLWESIKILVSNKYYVLILVLYLVYYFMSNLTTGSGIFFMTNVMGDGSLLGMFSMMKMFPVIIALVLTPILVKKFKSMQKVNFWGYLISDLFGFLLIYAAIQKNLTLMLVAMFIKGVFAGSLTGTLNALIAEISGYTYRTKKVHVDGMMFSCSSVGVKVGGGIGTAAVGWLLEASGYVGTAAVQSESAISMIFNMYITFPVLLGIVITVILGFLGVEKANQKLDAENGR